MNMITKVITFALITTSVAELCASSNAIVNETGNPTKIWRLRVYEKTHKRSIEGRRWTEGSFIVELYPKESGRGPATFEAGEDGGYISRIEIEGYPKAALDAKNARCSGKNNIGQNWNFQLKDNPLRLETLDGWTPDGGCK